MPNRKRLFDILFSAIGGFVLLPILFVIGLAILVNDGWPILFCQERVGYHGHLFNIYKFRTMVRNTNKPEQQLTVGLDARITRTGHWLRKLKLDELPQLLNVLKGEMSLVGPRPEVPRYVAQYSSQQRVVLELMPGITDPASISFRDEADILASSESPERVYIEHIMPEKIRLNLDYAARAGFISDALVILRTLGVLWKKPTKNA